MKNIIINNITVSLKNIDFGAICELEDLGLDVQSIGKKTFSSIRCAVAYHMDISIDEASKVIEEHITKGGKLADFVPFLEAITSSDFFKAIIAGVQENK
jgi:hypothetical protein